MICIYHGNCFDGFTAAWVVWKSFNGVRPLEFHPGVYGDPPPDVKGKDVILVDFSYERAVLEAMIRDCNSLVILDHHKTVKEDLEGVEKLVTGGCEQVRCVFDMERSGAGIAWDYLFGFALRPALIDHVEDRDLWRFKLSNTRNYHAAMSSYPFTFEAWEEINTTSYHQLLEIGQAIDRKHLQDVKNLLPIVTRYMTVGGFNVHIANLPMTMTSDAGNMLCEQYPDEPFAGCYWDTPKGRVFSLRSAPNGGADVAAIAQKYGGGGHVHAAGFTVPLEGML